MPSTNATPARQDFGGKRTAGVIFSTKIATDSLAVKAAFDPIAMQRFCLFTTTATRDKTSDNLIVNHTTSLSFYYKYLSLQLATLIKHTIIIIIIMEPQLTQGAIARIFGMSSSEDSPSFQPTLQVLNIRNVTSGGNQDRFRVCKFIVVVVDLCCCWS